MEDKDEQPKKKPSTKRSKAKPPPRSGNSKLDDLFKVLLRPKKDK